MAADETTSTASATATTTTNASGRWSFSALAENLYDVRITTGSTVRWRRQADEIQVEELETSVFKIRTPDNAFIYDIVPGAIAASRTLNLPVLLATDTLAVLGLAQTFSGAQTMGAGGVGLTVSADQRTNGIIYVGDNTNANMTAGLTLNQGAADNQILVDLFAEVHGIRTFVERNHGYYRIGMCSKKARESFRELIREHIIPSMQYKLG